jgi:hypothetical protein
LWLCRSPLLSRWLRNSISETKPAMAEAIACALRCQIWMFRPAQGAMARVCADRWMQNQIINQSSHRSFIWSPNDISLIALQFLPWKCS